MKELRTEVLIHATPEKIWGILTEDSNWGAWNPFIRSVIGSKQVGQRLKNTMVMRGQKPMIFTPKVLVAEPQKELRWLGQLWFPGIFDGEHYFILEALGENGCKLIHGEIFSGLLVFILNMKDAEASFIDLNEGLKKRAEA